MYNGLILYSAGSSDEVIMFTGLNDDLKSGFAIYGLDEKNTVTKYHLLVVALHHNQ